MNRLAHIRQNLEPLITNKKMRPFVCEGSPLFCRVFVVGFNPATTVGDDFWRYWSDDCGFDRFHFIEDYKAVRKLRGARPRIEAIVEQMPSSWCLETNICSTPTPRAADLAHNDRRTEIFRYLFEAIKPDLVFLHSNKPIEFFQRETGCGELGLEPTTVDWLGHCFDIIARPGPLWRMGLGDARVLGRRIAHEIWESPGGGKQAAPALPLIEDLFARRFSQWSIKLPLRDLRKRRAGIILHEGWRIQYLFGREGRGEYLDYLADHRMMWGREHIRVHEDGFREVLPIEPAMLPVSNDPEENSRLKEEFQAEIRLISEMLKAKGFV